ncbi:hypothetical protein GTO27_06520 [Candidatus Bathyarchaeota archaeon]|nr:hypothetical protein [Candidatus Bathyarchaeota archaeon]
MGLAKKVFEEILLEAIDEALDSLGESAKQAIYFHIENKFKIPRSEIPQKIDDFAEGLENIFGMGAQFLEILIMNRLHRRIGQPLRWNENEDLIFAEYVAAARRSFAEART